MKQNVIFEKTHFNKLTQQPDKLVEDYVDHCKYGDIKPEMIRDRLVVGIRDEKLQMESDLTLEKAKKIVRQREPVQQQQGAKMAKCKRD